MPVSELQELCAKNGLRNPEYRLVRTEGNSHSPLFTIKVFLNELELGEGMAKSKKAAKHNAAQKALVAIKDQKILTNVNKGVDPSIDLNKLRISDPLDHNCDSSSSATESLPVSSDSGCHSGDVNGSGQRNAVSILQEMCARNCFNLPDYVLSDQMGSCHEPVFHYSCEVMIGGEQVIGKSSGRTKQSAKKASAEDALKIIKEKGIPLYTTNNNIRKKTRSNAQNNGSNYEMINAYKETLDLMEGLQSKQDLDHLLDATGNDIDFTFRFNLIAEKLGCFANYIPLIDESSAKKYKCLLQMKRSQSQYLSKRLPIFVSWGNSCVSEQHAMQMAAQKAIIMVKVLKM